MSPDIQACLPHLKGVIRMILIILYLLLNCKIRSRFLALFLVGANGGLNAIPKRLGGILKQIPVIFQKKKLSSAAFLKLFSSSQLWEELPGLGKATMKNRFSSIVTNGSSYKKYDPKIAK